MKISEQMKLQRMLITQRMMKQRVALYQHRKTCPNCRAGQPHAGDNNIFTQLFGQVREEPTDSGTKH